MEITLRRELQTFVQDKVRQGRFADASEAVNEAVERLREEECDEYISYLRREIARGLEQLDRGEYAEFDAESIIARARAERGRR